MNTKIKFFPRLILLTLLLTLISCNEELYEIKDQHNGLDKNKISLTQFKNETDISRIDRILSVRATKSLSSKTKNQLSDFVIDTLAIKKLISENNKTTYTFRIYPLFEVAKPNEIYNLVYHKVNDTWETSIFYLKKLPEENSEHKLFEKIERIYGGKVANAVSSKTTNLEMCATEFKTVECNGSCRLEGYSKCDGFSCPTGECITRIIIYEFCSSGSGGGGGTFGDGTVYGGGGTSTSGSYSYSPNYFDNPAFEDPNYMNELNKSYVLSTLSPDQQKFFGTLENNKYFNQTIQYQIDNNWLDESFVLSQEMRIRKFNSPTVFNSITPFLIEKNINDINLNPCPKGVFTAVKNTTVCDIAQVLAKLDANGSVYNTTIKSGVDPSGSPAQTVRNSAYNYTIYISTNYEDKTKLFIAASMFHEMVHAYFMSLFDDYFNANPPNLNAYNDFAGLFHHYVTLKNPTSTNAADVHHQQMATDYVDAIARALQEYQTGIPVPSTSIPEQIYSDLAWGGLSDAPVFDATYSVGNPNRQRILNRYEAEQRNLPIGVIPNVQIPASVTCK